MSHSNIVFLNTCLIYDAKDVQFKCAWLSKHSCNGHVAECTCSFQRQTCSEQTLDMQWKRVFLLGFLWQYIERQRSVLALFPIQHVQITYCTYISYLYMTSWVVTEDNVKQISSALYFWPIVCLFYVPIPEGFSNDIQKGEFLGTFLKWLGMCVGRSNMLFQNKAALLMSVTFHIFYYSM